MFSRLPPVTKALLIANGIAFLLFLAVLLVRPEGLLGLKRA